MVNETQIEAGIFAAKHVDRDTIIDILEAADKARTSEAEPVAYLYEVDAGTDNACWCVCAKGDPGSYPVYLDC